MTVKLKLIPLYEKGTQQRGVAAASKHTNYYGIILFKNKTQDYQKLQVIVLYIRIIILNIARMSLSTKYMTLNATDYGISEFYFY